MEENMNVARCSPDDPYLDVIRSFLNRSKIKLWEPPYTDPVTAGATYPPEMTQELSTELKLDVDQIVDRLEFLRQNALRKQKEQISFRSNGLAKIKLKIGGEHALNNYHGSTFDVSLQLTETGRRLRGMIVDKLKALNVISAPNSTTSVSTSTSLLSAPNYSNLRLICRGRILNDDDPIQNQGLRNGSVVMVLLGTGIQSTQAYEARYQDVAQAKKAAEILSSSAGFDVDFSARNLAITDQNGKPIDFPLDEKKSLVQGMALHEKAKKLLKLKDYDSCLPLLIEADLCFSRCTGDVLKRVDNVALCHLDIAWCYLSLSNINDLPDAEERLRKCEECFQKTYGSDLSRAANLKGEVATTQALTGRLHLLQGILAFHKGDLNNSRRLLAQAEQELKALVVSPETISTLLLMGFSEQEARLGLRACNNNESSAVDWIMRRKGERQRNDELVRKQRLAKRRQEQYGKTVGGKEVNLSMFDQMMEMGFAEELVLASLKQTDNNMVAALNMIETEPELLISSQNASRSDARDSVPVPITDQTVAQLTALGFDAPRVLAALQRVNGNAERAVRVLCEEPSSSIPGEATTSSSSSSSLTHSLSSEEHETESETGNPRKKLKELSEEDMMAFEDLVEDLEFNEDKIDEHLDLALDEEMNFIAKYKSLL